jgi:hypothetical protein
MSLRSLSFAMPISFKSSDSQLPGTGEREAILFEHGSVLLQPVRLHQRVQRHRAATGAVIRVISTGRGRSWRDQLRS